jgi:PAS domain S-box-containing protein/putative nucleotidyltransferase with HDIG domain
MLEGVAHLEMVTDAAGRAADWVYRGVNPAFVRITGLSDVTGKLVSEVTPSAVADQGLLALYTRVAGGSAPAQAEIYFEPRGIWLRVSVFSPASGEVVALFDDITARKRAELDASLFASAIENASVPVMILDAGARILRANKRACQTLHYRSEALRSMTLADIDPDFESDRWPAFLEVLRAHGSQSFVREVQPGSLGERIPLELHLSIVGIGGDEVIVAFAHDISERLANERAQRERERTLSTLLGNLPGMAYRCANDSLWTMEFVSAGCTDLIGYAPEDLVGNALVAYGDLIAPDWGTRVWGDVQTAIAESRPWTVTYPLITRSGEEKWVWERGVAIRGADGTVKALEGLVTDVTGKHRAEERLEAAIAEWRETFDVMVDSVALFDAEGVIIRANAATAALTGLDCRELVGRRCFEVFHNASTFQPSCPQQRAIRTGKSEVSVTEQDGRWLRITFQPVFGERGEVEGGVHVVTDVTDVEVARRQLLESVSQQRAITDGVISAIAATTEFRDPYTAGHQRRVAELAAAIAQALGFDADHAVGVRVAAMLHDVGKITVPVEVLSKPGRLSDLEFEIIKTHAQAGHSILSSITFPWPVAEVALQHHERLDGSGYPQGLAADAISAEARIVAVADVVEAMSSHRPYRPTLGIDAALEEIRSGGGTRYDGAVVDACLGVIEAGFEFGS